MPAAPFGEVRWFERIDSTNRYLLDEAGQGAPEGLVVVADHQAAGRGRLGRRWEAPPGTCLLASLLLRPRLAPAELHLCTAAMAVAAVAACEQVAGVVPGIKWPNDLVVADAKLAGILAEADASAPGGAPGTVAVVVGVGINVTWPGPPEAGGTSLQAAGGGVVDRRQLLDGLLDQLGPLLGLLADAPGRRQLSATFAERCVTVGRRVRVELGDDTLVGTATGLDDDGLLEVQGPWGSRRVAAGDVVHLRPES
jgi:BirA family biotin operon repressor/biotin-[acetyl-CoA-carboxylase] ligase